MLETNITDRNGQQRYSQTDYKNGREQDELFTCFIRFDSLFQAITKKSKHVTSDYLSSARQVRDCGPIHSLTSCKFHSRPVSVFS